MSFIEQLKKNIKNNKKGFSLLELVLAVAIFSFSSFALATMIIDSNISTRLSSDRTEALLYAKESINAVGSIRDNNWSVWSSLPDGDYGLVIDSDSSTWVFSGSSDLINDKYTRKVTITTDPVVTSSKDVSVNISWLLNSSRIASTTLQTVFSNWISIINNVVLDGLISYWKFDDAGASTAIDSIISSGNDGTVYGATSTHGVKGLPNTAYSFNGMSDYVNIGASVGDYTNNFSIFAWIKPNTVSGPKRIFTRRGATTQYDFYIDTNSQLYFYTGTSYTSAAISNLANNWHLVGIVINGASSAFYADGNITGSTFSPTITSRSVNFEVGSWHSSNINGPFNGSIDNVRIYNRALSPDEITTIYNAEKP